MADTFTTNLNLTKPEVGASTDTWGTKINADLDALDAIFAVAGTAVNVKFASANFDDNAKAIFGTGDDLEIYHSGSHSIIKDGGTGNLLIQGDSVKIMNAAGDETFIDMPTDSHVALNYNNATKFQTSNTGATVTGTLVATLATAAQPNITSVGTLTSFRSTGIDDNADALAITIDSSENVTMAGDIVLGAGKAIKFNDDRFFMPENNVDGAEISANGVFKVKTGSTPTERMRIDSSGNVGIGETSPLGKLHVKTADSGASVNSNGDVLVLEDSGSAGLSILSGTSADSNVFFGDSGNNVAGVLQYSHNGDSFRISSTGALNLQTGGGNTRLHIDSAGLVGIGTTSPAQSLDTTGKIRIRDGGNTTVPSIQMGASGVDGLSLPATNTVAFITNSSERMRITSAGNLVVGTTIDYGHKFGVHGNAGSAGSVMHLRDVGNAGSGRDYIEFWNSATAVAGRIEHTSSTGVTYVTSSDYRMKENIRPLENGLSRLKQLKPVKFDWIENKESCEGFIAHEVDEIFTDAVAGKKDDEKMQGIDYGRITPLLVKAIQEQQTQIDALQSEINNLKGE